MLQRQRMAKRRLGRLTVATFLILAPMLAGGCPEFRNQVVDAAETATRGVIVSGQLPGDAALTAATSVISAAITLFYDQFRVVNRTTRF